MLVVTFLAVVFFWAAPSQAQDQPIKPDEPTQLFNGRDLSNFVTWIPGRGHDDPERVFSVVRNIDGFPAIRISGKEKGSLVSTDSFTNYRLVAEYRWGPVTWEWHYGKYTRAHRARDSGIQIHSQGDLGNWKENRNAAFMYGIQYQIREGRTGDFIMMGGWNEDGSVKSGPFLTVKARENHRGALVYHWNGEPRRISDTRNDPDRVRQIHWLRYDPDWINTKGYRGGGGMERPSGEWNTVEIIAKEDSIIHKLNGAVVNVGTEPSVQQGRILIQSEYAEIYIRRIDILPLKD